MPVKLLITEFSRSDKETTLGGTIENRGPAPKTYNLSVEFLDKSGAVVGSQKAAELFESAYDEHARRLARLYEELGMRDEV